jgi:hypothetical protein
MAGILPFDPEGFAGVLWKRGGSGATKITASGIVEKSGASVLRMQSITIV